MTETTTNQPSSILPLLLGTIATAGASYAFVGPSQYGWAVLGMVGLVFLLGASNQMKRGNALIINLLIGGLACGSSFLIAADMADKALIARALSFLLFAFVGLSAFAALLKILFTLAGIGLIIFLIGYAMKNVDGNRPLQEHEVIEEPIGEDTSVQENKETADNRPNDRLITHHQKWRDYNHNSYQGTLELWESNYKQSYTFKNKRLKPKRGATSPKDYWGSIYEGIVRNDTEHMARILDMFMQLGREKQLSKREFAQAIVSCVQSIPYVLIYRRDCSELASVNPVLADLAKKHSCKGHVAYGLQSPAEFMNDFKGDCDTRTVFLYTILDKLGYKVVILNSDSYGHSMLGIALPAAGKYKDHRGERYYFWETTAQGWNIGTLPPEMGLTNYWYVVLANQ